MKSTGKHLEASELVENGNHYRCHIVADEKKAILDFYFNVDGSTTIVPTGTDKDVSLMIKTILERKGVPIQMIQMERLTRLKNYQLDGQEKISSIFDILS